MAPVNAIFTNIAIFVTFAFGALVIMIHGWDLIMFRHKKCGRQKAAPKPQNRKSQR